ncbi:MAG: hypothetical protein ABII89_01460 [Candidatus Omnitrophota bacterium]
MGRTIKNYYGKYRPVPINLHQRVLLGTDFLVHNPDKRYGCLPTFTVSFDDKKTVGRHDFPDFGDLTSRYLEALLLAKQMTGSNSGDETITALKKLFLSFFRHRDGLNYRPPVDAPFQSLITGKPYQPEVAEGFDQSRVMFTLLTWFLITGEAKPKQLFDKLIDGIRSKAVIKNDYLYFAGPTFTPGHRPAPDSPSYPEQLYFAGTMILPLAKWYKLTGNTAALDTAGKLVNFIIKQSDYFGPDGSFTALEVKGSKSWDLINGHTHSRLGAIAGILKYGNLTSDKPVFEFGKRAFHWFYRNYCLLTGWCPEFVGRYPIEQEGCETCTLMDLVYCCLELCAAGHQKYWNLIERVARNQLLEQQLTDVSFLGFAHGSPGKKFESYPVSPKAVLGAFGGWCGVNDFISDNIAARHLMNCCGPSGVKTLYLVWQNIISWQDKTLSINMLLPRNSRYANIISHEPRKGKLEIVLRQNCRLQILIPEWVNKEQVSISVNGKIRANRWTGFQLLIEDVGINQKAVITYPLRSITLTEKSGLRKYRTSWVGSTVISIDPSGRRVPLYQRSQLLKSCKPMALPDYIPEKEITL